MNSFRQHSLPPLPLFVLVLFLGLAGGCAEETGPIEGHKFPYQVFWPNIVQIEADRYRTTLDTTITITTRCVSRISGEGRMSLYGGSFNDSPWILEQPYSDTIMKSSDGGRVQVRFTAGDTVTQRWTVRLTSMTTYSFNAWAYMQWVLDSASGKLVDIRSDRAREMSPWNLGYTPNASSEMIFIER